MITDKTPPMKVCAKCEVTKPFAEFRSNKKSPDGLYPRCFSCTKEDRREQYRKEKSRGHAYRAEYAAWYRQAHKEKAKKYSDDYRRQSPRSAVGQARLRALKRRPSDNPVSISELMEMYRATGGRCALSGVMMVWGNVGGAALTSVSIDRIDSSRGYERDNVRLICHGLNALKGSSTDIEMMELATALVDFQRENQKCSLAA